MKKWMYTLLKRRLLITLSLTLTLLPLSGCTQGKESTDISLTNLSSAPGIYDENLLTHRLIMSDARYKLATKEEINTALSNASFFLSEVKQDCKPNSDTQAFLQCANNILGKYFTYKETTLTSKGYSRQISDCDLNVYLLLDAARLFNKKLHIVYSPGHAFIAYTDARGVTQYWETIEPDNHGQPAELWTSAYAKTLHPFFYTPQSEDMIEKIYPLFILKELEEHKKEQLLSALHEVLQDNPLYLSAYYGNKKSINEHDINQLLHLLQSDTYSINKKIIAARYFINKDDYQQAKNLLNAIPLNNCKLDCLKEKERISTLYSFYRFISENSRYTSEREIQIKIDSFLEWSAYLVIIVLALIIAFCRIKISSHNNENHRRRKHDSRA